MERLKTLIKNCYDSVVEKWPLIQKMIKILLIVLVSLLALYIVYAFVGVFFFGGRWEIWTGFGPYIDADGKQQPAKTLWEWMQLLIIPLVLALGAFWLERGERISDRQIAKEQYEHDQEIAKERYEHDQKIANERYEHDQKIANERYEHDQKIANERYENDHEISQDQQREAALQTYYDKMTAMLLDKDHPLRESNPDDEVRVAARTRTLATLRTLDGERKGLLVKFLYEAELILKAKDPSQEIYEKGPIINFMEADLSGANLSSAGLSRVDLSGANLSKADLSEVVLIKANLSGANLREANLRWANLNEADMSRADLVRANLSMTHLGGTNISEANLSEADLSGPHLSRADLLVADLSGTHLSGVNLIGANLSNAYLSGADLSGADLMLANLSKADLKGAVLTRSNLTRAKISQQQQDSCASLEGAILEDIQSPDEE